MSRLLSARASVTALVCALPLSLLAVSAPASAQARLVPPDYARYCNTYYRPSFVNRLRATNEPICTRRVGRYAMYHYRIPIAEACRLTTGSRAFRRVGPGVYRCVVALSRPAPGRRTAIIARGRPPDYRRYCARFFPGTFPVRQRVTRLPLCARIISRYQRLYYRINIRAACRLTTGSTRVVRVAAGEYRCL